MSEKKIKFNRPAPTINRLRFVERMTDWHEDGHHVKSLLTKYDQDYRLKICSRCSISQRQKRNCLELDMYTASGMQLRHCGHMDKARVAKHKKMIIKHIQSNPALGII